MQVLGLVIPLALITMASAWVLLQEYQGKQLLTVLLCYSVGIGEMVIGVGAYLGIYPQWKYCCVNNKPEYLDTW